MMSIVAYADLDTPVDPMDPEPVASYYTDLSGQYFGLGNVKYGNSATFTVGSFVSSYLLFENPTTYLFYVWVGGSKYIDAFCSSTQPYMQFSVGKYGYGYSEVRNTGTTTYFSSGSGIYTYIS